MPVGEKNIPTFEHRGEEAWIAFGPATNERFGEVERHRVNEPPTSTILRRA